VNALFLTKYDQLAASTRYRFTQFVPALEQAGVQVTIAPLLDDAYLAGRFAGRGGAARSYAQALTRRVRDVLAARRYDRVVLYCEAFPYLPPVLEALLGRLGTPYYYDLDDAFFHQYDAHSSPLVRRLLGDKIGRVLRGAAGVTAGNAYLAEYARRFNPNVWVVPTVVDTERYVAAAPSLESAASRPFTIGWIGSPSTAPYLREVEGALRRFCAATGARLITVGAGSFALDGVPHDARPWSEATEVGEIQGFDVGIMPLPDTPWARGKCAFKLIQYMACGVPVIASPVGMNTTLVEPDRHGFHARTEQDWLRALEALHADAALRARMGAAGRVTIDQEYSLAVTAPRLVGIWRDGVDPAAAVAG
jgi:glycosyltransferase involved in cell wall biosynthesis